MIKTSLCYLEKDGKYLMLHRTKKHRDPNEGKWIGVGGKFERGESPDACVRREVLEETGIRLLDMHFYGVIEFRSDTSEDEDMYLYSSDSFDDSGYRPEDCVEGELAYIHKDQILSLNLWEGDRVFLSKMLAGEASINLRLTYHEDKLIDVKDFLSAD